MSYVPTTGWAASPRPSQTRRSRNKACQTSAHQAGAWTYNEANQLLQYPRMLDENAPAQQSQTEQVSASYHYLLSDHLGAPVLALNKAGEATWKARYEAFGKARIDNASTAQINLRLPGQYFDAETGLHQNWNRDYAPGIGRYVQADPLGIFGGMNVYQYAYGNPLVYYDPYGLFGMDSVWGGIYRMTGGWTPSQGSVDFLAGFGDVMSLQLTKKTRKIFDFGQSVDVCSNSYFIGEMATMLIPIGMLGRVSKIARFSNNPFKYELGQKTVSDKVWKELGLANKTPEQRSDIIIASKGWLYAFFSFSGNWRATLPTGPTPGAAAGLVVVAAGMGGYAISQKLDCICK